MLMIVLNCIETLIVHAAGTLNERGLHCDRALRSRGEAKLCVVKKIYETLIENWLFWHASASKGLSQLR